MKTLTKQLKILKQRKSYLRTPKKNPLKTLNFQMKTLQNSGENTSKIKTNSERGCKKIQQLKMYKLPVVTFSCLELRRGKNVYLYFPL